ncbi:MAG: transposase [Treponema sp.]|nr:transposase [Treponema sp.]
MGTEKDHAHFLAQPVRPYSPAGIVQKIKNITARKIFEGCPEARRTRR